MSHPTSLRSILKQRRTALNGWIATPSVLAAEAMAAAGWDTLTVDMQHGTADYTDLLAILPVVDKAGAVPLVRVPWLDEAAIMRALDAGAMGIISPMIESPEAAERLVKACLYPPEGGRSFGPIRARLVWQEEYSTASANSEIAPLAMIETRRGFDALDEIVAVPGLAGIYIGPGDLALSFGHAPHFDPEEPDLTGAIARIREKTAAAGLLCCLHCGSVDYAVHAARMGMDLVTIGSDARFIEAGARGTVGDFAAKL